MREALGRRFTVMFNNGLIINFCGNGVISSFNEELKNFKPEESWIKTNIEGVFNFKTQAKIELIEEIIDENIESFGKPKLILPWDDFFENIIEENEEDDEHFELVSKVNEILASSSEEADQLPVEITYGEDCLPSKCDYARFEMLVEKLEEENWIVIWDECCGACARSSIEDQKTEEPDKVDSPAFVIYGQSAENYFKSDGSIINYLLLPDERGQEREIEIARELGFNVTKSDTEGFFNLN